MDSPDKYFSNNSFIDELDSIFTNYLKNNTSYKCLKCFKEFESEYLLSEHKIIHDNEIENTVCICKTCYNIFESDADYLLHKNNCNDKSILFVFESS